MTVGELRDLIRDACPAVELVCRIASLDDVGADFVDGQTMRKLAREALNGEAFVFPVIYGEEERERPERTLPVRRPAR